MTKCEVIFSGSRIIVGSYSVKVRHSHEIECWYVSKGREVVFWDYSLEEAIKYCMEN